MTIQISHVETIYQGKGIHHIFFVTTNQNSSSSRIYKQHKESYTDHKRPEVASKQTIVAAVRQKQCVATYNQAAEAYGSRQTSFYYDYSFIVITL